MRQHHDEAIGAASARAIILPSRLRCPRRRHSHGRRKTPSGERFFFDRSALCAQTGVSTDAVRRKLFGDGATEPIAAE
ncbi:hypothetical protein E8M01_34045 [Phreatobacter stygius]|uniref:Uncharacterized protein n=1 Tax=Phreatobacter stygius TaxID=1940610 RepID=A0A4D7BE18_9HYPH|nr:hypothetical protein E8M01_34045 [Phreatobacter stygius]